MKYYVLYNVTSHKFAAKTSMPAVFGFLAETNEGTEFCLLVTSCCRVKTDSPQADIDITKPLANAGLHMCIPILVILQPWQADN